mmetsp:Transcript_11601/g.34173  ORF Transcript_11601/g.34173 Transcript_11601/m.34173 type:complete len:274 (+) Transcript_11601:292-1113(+)
MRIDERLVIKFTAVDRSTSRPITLGHISPLDHEILDDPMERTALVMQRLVPVADGQKIVHRFRDRIIVQLHENSTLTDAIDGNVEEGPLQALLVVYRCQRVRTGLREVVILITEIVVVIYLAGFLGPITGREALELREHAAIGVLQLFLLRLFRGDDVSQCSFGRYIRSVQRHRFLQARNRLVEVLGLAERDAFAVEGLDVVRILLKYFVALLDARRPVLHGGRYCCQIAVEWCQRCLDLVRLVLAEVNGTFISPFSPLEVALLEPIISIVLQ